MDIENGGVIKIYKNWKSDGPAWAIDNKNPPKVEGYGSARFLLMEFQSRKPDSSKKKSKGFRGVFKVKGGEGKIQIAWARPCLFRHLVLKENKQKCLEMRNVLWHARHALIFLTS